MNLTSKCLLCKREDKWYTLLTKTFLQLAATAIICFFLSRLFYICRMCWVFAQWVTYILGVLHRWDEIYIILTKSTVIKVTAVAKLGIALPGKTFQNTPAVSAFSGMNSQGLGILQQFIYCSVWASNRRLGVGESLSFLWGRWSWFHQIQSGPRCHSCQYYSF